MSSEPAASTGRRRRLSSVGALPTGRAIDVLVKSLLSLDDQLTAVDMDHAVRNQYSFLVKKWLETPEGRTIDKLVNNVALQDASGEKARRVMNEIIHKIPPTNAEDHHTHHGHVISALPTVGEEHQGLVRAETAADGHLIVHRTRYDEEGVAVDEEVVNEDAAMHADSQISKKEEKAGEEKKSEGEESSAADSAKMTTTETSIPEELKGSATEYGESDAIIRKRLAEKEEEEEWIDPINRPNHELSIRDYERNLEKLQMSRAREEKNDHKEAKKLLEEYKEQEREAELEKLHEHDDDTFDDLYHLDSRLRDDVYDDEVELCVLFFVFFFEPLSTASSSSSSSKSNSPNQ